MGTLDHKTFLNDYKEPLDKAHSGHPVTKATQICVPLKERLTLT
jgi:hypothetical protein